MGKSRQTQRPSSQKSDYFSSARFEKVRAAQGEAAFQKMMGPKYNASLKTRATVADHAGTQSSYLALSANAHRLGGMQAQTAFKMTNSMKPVSIYNTPAASISAFNQVKDLQLANLKSSLPPISQVLLPHEYPGMTPNPTRFGGKIYYALGDDLKDAKANNFFKQTYTTTRVLTATKYVGRGLGVASIAFTGYGVAEEVMNGEDSGTAIANQAVKTTGGMAGAFAAGKASVPVCGKLGHPIAKFVCVLGASTLGGMGGTELGMVALPAKKNNSQPNLLTTPSYAATDFQYNSRPARELIDFDKINFKLSQVTSDDFYPRGPLGKREHSDYKKDKDLSYNMFDRQLWLWFDGKAKPKKAERCGGAGALTEKRAKELGLPSPESLGDFTQMLCVKGEEALPDLPKSYKGSSFRKEANRRDVEIRLNEQITGPTVGHCAFVGTFAKNLLDDNELADQIQGVCTGRLQMPWPWEIKEENLASTKSHPSENSASFESSTSGFMNSMKTKWGQTLEATKSTAVSIWDKTKSFSKSVIASSSTRDDTFTPDGLNTMVMVRQIDLVKRDILEGRTSKHDSETHWRWRCAEVGAVSEKIASTILSSKNAVAFGDASQTICIKGDELMRTTSLPLMIEQPGLLKINAKREQARVGVETRSDLHKSDLDNCDLVGVFAYGALGDKDKAHQIQDVCAMPINLRDNLENMNFKNYSSSYGANTKSSFMGMASYSIFRDLSALKAGAAATAEALADLSILDAAGYDLWPIPGEVFGEKATPLGWEIFTHSKPYKALGKSLDSIPGLARGEELALIQAGEELSKLTKLSGPARYVKGLGIGLGIGAVGLAAYEISTAAKPLNKAGEVATSFAFSVPAALTAGKLSATPCATLGCMAPVCVATATIAGGVAGSLVGTWTWGVLEKAWEYSKRYSIRELELEEAALIVSSKTPVKANMAEEPVNQTAKEATSTVFSLAAAWGGAKAAKEPCVALASKLPVPPQYKAAATGVCVLTAATAAGFGGSFLGDELFEAVAAKKDPAKCFSTSEKSSEKQQQTLPVNLSPTPASKNTNASVNIVPPTKPQIGQLKFEKSPLARGSLFNASTTKSQANVVDFSKKFSGSAVAQNENAEFVAIPKLRKW